MADPQTVAYIRQLQGEFSDIAIRAELQKAGYLRDDVEAAFQEIENSKGKTAPPGPIPGVEPNEAPAVIDLPGEPEPPAAQLPPVQRDTAPLPAVARDATPQLPEEAVRLSRPPVSERPELIVAPAETTGYFKGTVIILTCGTLLLAGVILLRKGPSKKHMGTAAPSEVLEAELPKDDRILTPEAEKNFLSAAMKGDVEAEVALGRHNFVLGLYQYEQADAAEAFKKASTWLKSASDKGHLEGMFRYGVLLLHGMGIKQDADRGLHLVTLSAQGGFALAQSSLGSAYRFGRDVPQDSEEALQWLEMAAEQNEPDALYDLARMYGEGRGVKTSKRKMAELLARAAQAGSGVAAFRIGEMYEEGEHYKPDLAQARQWYLKAAEQDEVWALFHLGGFYQFGRGVPVDHKEAVAWYRKAAYLGYGPAMNNLGFLLVQGEGIEHFPVEAYFWYTLAARQKMPEAVESQLTLAKELNHMQTEKAERRADNFRPRLKKL